MAGLGSSIVGGVSVGPGLAAQDAALIGEVSVPSPEGDDDCYSIGLYCANADDVVARAEAAGATIREPLSTFVSGDRYASIRDPFGVRWSVMTRVEDLSELESARRIEEWAAAQSAGQN